MLKIRGRTEETSVMEAEEWPQVVNINMELFNRNKDYEQDQKGSLQERSDALCQRRK